MLINFFVSFISHRMGRKFRLGRVPKNYEKNPKRKRKPVGRPRKFTISLYPSSNNQSLSNGQPSTSRPSNEERFQMFTNDLVLPSNQWIIQTQNSDRMGICKLSCSLKDTMVVTHSVVVTQDLSWTLTVHGKEVNPQMCSALSDTPKTLSTATLQTLICP